MAENGNQTALRKKALDRICSPERFTVYQKSEADHGIRHHPH